LVALWVLGVEVLVTEGHNSWLNHHLLLGFLSISELQLNLFVGLFLIDTFLMSLLLKNGEGSSLPTFEIALIIIEKNTHVGTFELFDFLFVYYHENGGHNFRAMCIHEHALGNLLFIDNISKVLLHE